jgi:glycosyltransferase involved in cell wall biosynthesis
VIASALAVLVPARREALAPLCLEAWREARPVLAAGSSAVMRGMLERTGGGLAARGFDELSGALDLLEREPELAEALGRCGRRALAEEHALSRVLDRHERVLLGLRDGKAAA